MYTINTKIKPDITKAEVDYIRILPATKTMEVQMKEGYDEDGTFKNVQAGEKKIYMDRPAVDKEAATTEYTDALAGMGIDLTKVEDYIK